MKIGIMLQVVQHSTAGSAKPGITSAWSAVPGVFCGVVPQEGTLAAGRPIAAKAALALAKPTRRL